MEPAFYMARFGWNLLFMVRFGYNCKRNDRKTDSYLTDN